MRESDLEQIRYTTKALARCVEPKLAVLNGETLPILDGHPFLQTNLWVSRLCKPMLTADGKTIQSNTFSDDEVDLCNPSVYKEWLATEFDVMVDKSDLTRIYDMWRTPYKLTFIKFCGDFLSAKDYADYLADAWVTEENPNMDCNMSVKESIRAFLKADKHYLMDKEDYKYYQNLPCEVEVYRGVSNGRTEMGLSWTDDKDKAEWFMNRFNGNDNKLLKAVINKKNVLAYFNTRNEKELVVNVYAIKDKIERIK